MVAEYGLNYIDLLHFSECVNRGVTKKGFVYFVCDGKNLSFYTMNETASVFYNRSAEGLDPSYFGIEANRFIQLFKRTETEPVLMRVTPKSVEFEIGPVRTKFPQIFYVAPPTYPDSIRVTGENKDWIVNNLGRMNKSVDDDKRFPGILLDNSLEVAHLCKVSPVAIRVAATKELPLPKSRIVVPPEIGDIAKALAQKIDAVLISQNHVGFDLVSGSQVFVCQLADNYPADYLSPFGLTRKKELIDEFQVGYYAIERKELLRKLELMNSMLGEEEVSVRCERLGGQWRLSGKTFTGCEADVLIDMETEVQEEMRPFGVHGKRFRSALQTYEEPELLFFNKDSLPLMISDAGLGEVTLLVKSNV